MARAQAHSSRGQAELFDESQSRENLLGDFPFFNNSELIMTSGLRSPKTYSSSSFFFSTTISVGCLARRLFFASRVRMVENYPATLHSLSLSFTLVTSWKSFVGSFGRHEYFLPYFHTFVHQLWWLGHFFFVSSRILFLLCERASTMH